jgi:hypothetical protein
MSGAEPARTIARARPARAVTGTTSGRAMVAALALVGALIAGCSNGTSTPTPTPTPTPGATTAPTSPGAGGGGGGASSGTPAYCAAANKLKASVGALGSLSVSSGLTGVQTAIDNIQASLTEFQTAARSQFGPQIQQMQTALSDVKSAIRAASASPSTSSVTAIGTAAAAVVAAYSTLQKEISSRCG